MTSKSTITSLRLQQKLFPLVLRLEPGEAAHRFVYGTPGFMTWWSQELPKLPMDVEEVLSPKEQIFALLTDFASGLRMDYPKELEEMKPPEGGIWEFQTVDVRVFGFFPERNHFIGVFGDSTKRCHDYGLHRGYMNECIRICDRELVLDRIFGGKIDDVIT
ncbi:MAG: hypothetical protein ACM31D_00770 [Bacteroidota bacterium]